MIWESSGYELYRQRTNKRILRILTSLALLLITLQRFLQFNLLIKRNANAKCDWIERQLIYSPWLRSLVLASSNEDINTRPGTHKTHPIHQCLSGCQSWLVWLKLWPILSITGGDDTTTFHQLTKACLSVCLSISVPRILIDQDHDEEQNNSIALICWIRLNKFCSTEVAYSILLLLML